MEMDHTFNQWFHVAGTGPDSDNYTVIMDFWHETARPRNRLCLYPDASQGVPGSGNCSINANFSEEESCLTAVDVMSGRAPLDMGMHDPKRTRGSGCKNDGGPLWISIELADSPDDIVSAIGAGDVPRTVWGRIFQKK